MSFPIKGRKFRPVSGKTFPIRSDRVAAFDKYDFTTVIAETIQAVMLDGVIGSGFLLAPLAFASASHRFCKSDSLPSKP